MNDKQVLATSAGGPIADKEDAAELRSYSVHIAVVLSVVFSFTAVAIFSKQLLTHQLLACVLACALPMPIALYFRNRIALFGLFTYVAALIIALIAAILFGI
jgi:hypothetical protein